MNKQDEREIKNLILIKEEIKKRKLIGYALIESTGIYEDNTETIIGVFMDKDKAEQYQKEYTKKDKLEEEKYLKAMEDEDYDYWYEPSTYFVKEVTVYD